MRDDRERLLDILEAIHNIERYVNDQSGHTASQQSELVEVWIIHHLQIIGEAASRISNEVRQSYPEVAWGGMIGMRHALVHGYFEIDSELVWRAVQRDLPTLKVQIQKILADLK